MNQTFDYDKYRPELIISYGINLDETTASILFVLLEEQKKTFEEQNLKLDNSIKKINSESKTLQIDSRNPKLQAFWLGMGQFGFFMSLLIILVAILIVNYENNKSSNNARSKELAAYKEYYIRSKSPMKKKNN